MGTKYRSLGLWLRDTREVNGLTQKELAALSNGVISTASISAYEADKVKDISAAKLLILADLMDVPRSEIPWDLVEQKYRELEDSERLGLYDIPEEVSSVRLFNGKTYEVQGMLAKETITGEWKPIAQIYYQVRTARAIDSNAICAKRKRPHEELTRTKYG